jgi:hypothetical protein
MVVPSTTIVPPGVRVWPLMIYVVPDMAVNVFEPTVSSGALVMTGRLLGVTRLVCPLMTTAVAPAASDMVVPSTVIIPPGVSVDDPMR